MKKIPVGKKCLINKDGHSIWCPFYEDIEELDPLYGVCQLNNQVIFQYNKQCRKHGIYKEEVQGSDDLIRDIYEEGS